MVIILGTVSLSVYFSGVIFRKLIVSVAGTKTQTLLLPMIGSGSKGFKGLRPLYLMMENIQFPKLMLKKIDDK
jgi:hypothetical protein